MHCRAEPRRRHWSLRTLVILAVAIALLLGALAGYIVASRSRGAAMPTARGPEATVPRAASESAPSPAGSAVDDRVGDEKARIMRSLDAEAWRLRSELADREADSTEFEPLRLEREQLFVALADARGETARYRQLALDIENNAPPPILLGAAEPDDLKLIVGVGPVLERMLHNLGIGTFRQIARWTERDIAEFDARLPEFPGRIVRDQWVTQARALHESKYGERP